MDSLEELYNLYDNTNFGCWACKINANPYTGFGPNGGEKCRTRCAVYKMYIKLKDYEERYVDDGK